MVVSLVLAEVDGTGGSQGHHTLTGSLVHHLRVIWLLPLLLLLSPSDMSEFQARERKKKVGDGVRVYRIRRAELTNCI